MILQKSVQEVLDAARVEDVISDFVTLKRRGANMLGLCPFHNEKTPSFIVSPAKNLFKCFGCGQGGDAVKFVMEHEHLSFPDAIRYLARKYRIALEEKEVSAEVLAEQHAMESLYLVNQFARDYYQEQLFESDMGKSVGLSYFKQRGFREETIRKFGLGFAPDKNDAFTLTAIQAGYKLDTLQQLGLSTQYSRDFFRNRVMFTIHNLSGKVIAFAGRIMVKDAKAPKYVNSPETEIYHKSQVLYGAFFAKTAIRKEDECMLVEGYTDVISLHQAGIENVVASSGTSLTVDQIRLIKRYTPNVKILYDGDFAGIKAALRGVDLLLEQDMNVRIVLLPDGEDPDSYLQKVGTEAFKTYVKQAAQDFILFKSGLLLEEAGKDPIKKAQLIKEIVGSIALIPDPLKRSTYIQECAAVFGVDEQLLVSETNKIVSQRVGKQQQQREAVRDKAAGLRDELPEGVGEAPAEEGMPPMPAGDTGQFLEKDLVRVVIQFGAQVYDTAANLSVAAYIISNIQDVLDFLDHPVYKQVLMEAQVLLSKGAFPGTDYFINHEDVKVAELAVGLLVSPYEYSDNWATRWDIHLSQKHPDENFFDDSSQALRRFRFEKIGRIQAEVTAKIAAAAQAGNSEEVIQYLRVKQQVDAVRMELAKEFGTVYK